MHSDEVSAAAEGRRMAPRASSLAMLLCLPRLCSPQEQGGEMMTTVCKRSESSLNVIVSFLETDFKQKEVLYNETNFTIC